MAMQLGNDPPPGSAAAKEAGCTCPVMDNCRGAGRYGIPGYYVIVVGCPLHCLQGKKQRPERPAETERP